MAPWKAGVLLAVMLLVVSACGSRVDWPEHAEAHVAVDVADAPGPPRGQPPADAGQDTAGDPAPSGAGGEPDAPVAAEGEPNAPEPDAGGDNAPARTERPGLDPDALHIALSAACVSHGQTLTITLHGPARAGMAGAVSFADHRSHGARFTGESGDDGRFTWRVPISPTAPTGPAKVMATTSGPDWSSEGRGRATAEFTVARIGGC